MDAKFRKGHEKRIMKKKNCGKIIDYQLLQENLWVSKVEIFWRQKSFDRKKNFFFKMVKKFRKCLES